ncbi:unnamed protein product [Mytilus edulis]|uniref:Reverse transcriptase/retrotransposon-derived protein RNase H-like domain-containing protein n=1 Tax=Mytilus edulis TaxID=6550 RepID=A0A8S3Q550_MYTED|nr:unnamed protein product [Mytilus edulis]
MSKSLFDSVSDKQKLSFEQLDCSEIWQTPKAISPPPFKREILREHLDNLLKQGIIAPVSETEDLLITSPIVLVTKRSKNSAKPCAQDFRFCCDFRFLNSQTREFKYAIPNLQELTESFSEVIPNFISSIDLSSASSCVFLGHLISKDGIRPPPDRVKAISDYPRPKNIKELRRLLGLFNWFRKFIPNYSALVFPLTRLLKKEQIFTWRSEQETAFNDLKHKLVNSDILSFPKFDLTFRLSVDTSARGIGYMLYQLDPDDETQKPRIIRFGSKSLSPWQQSYGPTKLELLGMVVSILDCADYLRGNSFIAECDHQALKPLYQKQFKGAIYERWMSILQQFSFEIVYKKADDMQVPDALSRCENSKAEVVESPVEDDPFFPFVEDVCGKVKLPNG